ncbi:rho guanine nucleotide exchange factor 37 [Erpetoichthys calabaricus]|uniref:Rho guanine nucleotide exchange factor 37 n=1 Tax=Erpetoichthys calabaricus TaxID=27687 RepID=A0A8C4X9Y9_ERPCA|nr:rho guanine nucleotide exchange factor 37 [Erpetoichthys calabaricus]XP_028668745.1 rho guanine nucleotide exchange factor 37 [Erpetoichthys calabaricus]XP_028668746.1 rho guanine nucleotide exchange factor 37 [Erpetoichthys calabaricus]
MEPIYCTVLPGSPDELGVPAEADRTKHKQCLTIEELLSTERSYLNMIQLCAVDIRNCLKQKQLPDFDLEGLFANIDDVIDVSSKLLYQLELMDTEDPQYLQALSDTFLSMRSDLENTYKEYCASYSNILILEARYREREELDKIIQETITRTAPHTNATNLSFFLVMPVQRIARYQLLLQTILKNTEPSHPAYQSLQAAVDSTIALNSNINEYKRLKEVADKYNKPENLTLMDKIYRINTHSIAKKTARLSQMLKHEAGFLPKTEDKEFDALEEYFLALERGVADLQDNVSTYVKHFEEFLSRRPHECELDIETEVAFRNYKELSAILHKHIYPKYMHRLKSLVLQPLCSLQELLACPQNMIRKRLHKLLDFEKIEEKRRETGSLTYEEQEAANTYQAINTLLLTEMPKFNGMAAQLLTRAMETFIFIQRDFAADVNHIASGYLQHLPHNKLPDYTFWSWAEGMFLKEAKSLQHISQSFEAELNPHLILPLTPSSQRRLSELTKRYKSEQIYQASSEVKGGRDMDLSLSRGELVAVIQEMDTKGDKRRWLVEAGGNRGYVPASRINPYHPTGQTASPSPAIVDEASKRHSFVDASPAIKTPVLPSLQVFAAYDFSARSNHEVSLRAGELVTILEHHDKQGNPQWTLVEVQGQKGYVPSNYLMVVPVPGISASSRKT